MASLDIFMYYKPGPDLGEGEDADPEKMRVLGDSIKERMHSIATTVEKLTSNGWEVGVGLYSLCAINRNVRYEDVAQHLKDIGVDEEDVSIMGFDDENDENDEGDECCNDCGCCKDVSEELDELDALEEEDQE